MAPLTIYGASAQLGYGLSESSLTYVQSAFDIDAIAADAGSNDPGPYYYGTGEFFASADTIKRDFRFLLRARDELGVPLVVANVATGGTATHLDRVSALVREIAAEEGLSFDLAKIYTDVDASLLQDQLAAGNVRSIDGITPELTADMVDRAEQLVGCVGHEPYLEALAAGYDVILGGRSLDIAPYVALAFHAGYPEAVGYHCGKLLECAGTAAEPKPGHESIIGSAGIVGQVSETHFELMPANPNERCTVRAAAIQTMHEKADPFTIFAPEGTTDIAAATYEQDGDSLRISGAVFEPNESYEVLIEGVEQTGYRTIAIIYITDRAVAENLEHIVERTTANLDELLEYPADSYSLTLRKMGDSVREDASLFRSDDDVIRDMGMGLVIDVVGETQDIATDVCSLFKSKFKSLDFPDRIGVGGNMLIPYSKSEVPLGPEYVFSVYHVLEGDAGTTIPEIEGEVVGR